MTELQNFQARNIYIKKGSLKLFCVIISNTKKRGKYDWKIFDKHIDSIFI